jgi:hypothetical protein
MSEYVQANPQADTEDPSDASELLVDLSLQTHDNIDAAAPVLDEAAGDTAGDEAVAEEACEQSDTDEEEDDEMVNASAVGAT